jgi:hypothetical protein
MLIRLGPGIHPDDTSYFLHFVDQDSQTIHSTAGKKILLSFSSSLMDLIYDERLEKLTLMAYHIS